MLRGVREGCQIRKWKRDPFRLLRPPFPRPRAALPASIRVRSGAAHLLLSPRSMAAPQVLEKALPFDKERGARGAGKRTCWTRRTRKARWDLSREKNPVVFYTWKPCPRPQWFPRPPRPRPRRSPLYQKARRLNLPRWWCVLRPVGAKTLMLRRHAWLDVLGSRRRSGSAPLRSPPPQALTTPTTALPFPSRPTTRTTTTGT